MGQIPRSTERISSFCTFWLRFLSSPRQLVVVESKKCDFADRNVPSVRRPLRRTAAAITWCVNDANMTSVGSVSLHGNLTAHRGESTYC